MRTSSRWTVPRWIAALVLAVALVAGLAAPPVAAGAAETSPAAAGQGGTDAPASTAAHGVLVQGTVTDEEGRPVEEAYVLVQPIGERMLQNATSGDEPIRRSLLDLVEEHPFGLYYNATTDGGHYAVHVPRPANYEVIAVTPDGVSRLRKVAVRVQGAERNLTVDADRVLSVETGHGSAASGEVATVDVRVPNPGDDPVENLTVTLSPPGGWTVEGIETAGDWDADARRVTFERVDPGGVATATVRIRVPENATRESVAVAVTADARTHFVEHGRARIAVGSAAPTPTSTSAPTDERFSFDSPSRPTDSRPTALYLLSAGVFAVGVAFAGYSVWRTGPPRIR